MERKVVQRAEAYLVEGPVLVAQLYQAEAATV